MKNNQVFKIFLNSKNIAEVRFIGDQTEATVDQAIKSIVAFANRLVTPHRKPVFLIDYAEMGKSTMASRQRAIRGMKEIPFQKMAGINAGAVIKFFTNAIAGITGNSDRARHFSTRAEAERWLLET